MKRGDWKIGLALALTSALLWGVLPIALTVVLQGLDAFTVTWYRFAFAAVFLGILLTATNSLPRPGLLSGRVWLLLIIALGGLTGNYVLYVTALPYTSPTTAQTVTQLGPVFLLLGGLMLFKEEFSAWQWTGFFVLVGGLALFFNTRLLQLAHPSSGLGLGLTLLVIAMFVWAVYGLAQKRLLSWLGAQQILFLLYVGAVFLLLHWTTLGEVVHLTRLQGAMLLFCCLNTVVAYGAFAEGLKHWEASRFGAVLSTSPLFTVAGMWIAERIAPTLVVPERLNPISVAGTLLVVGGAATCALARGVKPPTRS